MVREGIRRDVPIPYYYQLGQLLRQEIEVGFLLPNSPIPSEYELCATYGVSRTVVRQALGDLVAEGLLYRVKGKGTFVAPRKLEEKFVQRSDGFYREMTARGLTVTTAVLEQRVVPPPPHVRQALRLAEGDGVIKLDRLRSIDGNILLFVQTYVPAVLCPDLADADLSSGSLYALLRERYGLSVASGTRTVEAVLAHPPLTALLGVARGNPLLKIDSISFMADGRPLEYYEAWHRGDRSKLEIEMVVDSESVSPSAGRGAPEGRGTRGLATAMPSGYGVLSQSKEDGR
ncbi:MAG TPA: GntR family transcriptional regulator [Chloroflexota bacterium]|nr:GntR family transcriptional regulator [Chloroflexota bacterium]